MHWRAAVCAACFAGLVASATLPPHGMVFLTSEERRSMAVVPDGGGWAPDYPRFLEEVRARTKAGDTIALVVPTMRWERGYFYAYYRASYFLAGREVLPLVTVGNVRIRANLARARYVAVWRSPLPPKARIVFASHRGALVSR